MLSWLLISSIPLTYIGGTEDFNSQAFFTLISAYTQVSCALVLSVD